MSPTGTLFATFAVTVIGSGLGTTIIGAWFKKRLDSQLATYQALLQRTGKVHERQVDALLQIYFKLEEALFYLQRATSAGKLKNEVSETELLERMAKSLASASEEFAKNKLLFSENLCQKLAEFFDTILEGGMTMQISLEPVMAMSPQRAEFWKKAGTIAHTKLPAVLKLISKEGRDVIHS